LRDGSPDATSEGVPSADLPRAGSWERLPFASESFDVITMIEVLEHTGCDEEVLENVFVFEAGRFCGSLCPEQALPIREPLLHVGHLSIGPNIPLISWFPDALRKRLCDARIYTRRRLYSLTRSAAFGLIRWIYFPPLDSFRLPSKSSTGESRESLKKLL